MSHVVRCLALSTRIHLHRSDLPIKRAVLAQGSVLSHNAISSSLQV